jgi:hypothetical protein
MSLNAPSETYPSGVSAAKLAANRANAQHSTGPRTEEGKARSSRNAVKHGLFSQAAAESAAGLSEAEQAALDALVLDGRQRYQPRGAEEEACADRLATLWWELQRTSARRHAYARARAEAGATEEGVVRACAALHARERQLERSIRHERQDLVFVQRLRNGELCRHRRAELEAHDRLLETLAEEQERAKLRLMDSPRAALAQATVAQPAPSQPAQPAPRQPAPPAPRQPAQPIDPAIIPHAARALALMARAGLPVNDAVPPMERVPVRLPPYPAPSGTGRRPAVPSGSDG